MADTENITEKWRIIDDAPEYAISSNGRVRRIVANRRGLYAGIIKQPSIGGSGYKQVDLYINGRRLKRAIHRLVCEAFNGPPSSSKYYAAHIDGDKFNNTPNNLYWATPTENAADMIRHGRTCCGDRNGSRKHPERRATGERHRSRTHPESVQRGEACSWSKLTEEAVKEIIATPKVYGSGLALARKFGVHKATISDIRKGRRWGYLYSVHAVSNAKS